MRRNKQLRILIENRKENLDVISDGTKDTSALLEAVAIAEKQEKGEQISQQEKDKLKDIKEQYESFLDESEVTETEGLKDALTYTIEDKKSYIEIDNNLKNDIINKKNNIIEENKGSLNLLEQKNKASLNLLEQKNKDYLKLLEQKNKGSLIDDYADLNDQMPDFFED